MGKSAGARRAGGKGARVNGRESPETERWGEKVSAVLKFAENGGRGVGRYGEEILKMRQQGTSSYAQEKYFRSKIRIRNKRGGVAS